MLESFFEPRSVAVIGASRESGKVGHDVLQNLIRYGFKGKIYPVNPKAKDILGLPCFPSVRDVPGEVDLAVIVVPARFALGVIEDCAARKVPAVIIITAGFKEVGREGAEIERKIVACGRQSGMRIVGPNCLGLISTYSNLNASFAAGMPEKGNIAFLSQSGAFGTAVLDWAIEQRIGFSKFISVGNKADVDEVSLIEVIGADADSSVLLGYVESIKNGGEFMRVASEVSKHKPLIIMKSGGTAAGARAASSHTGALTGSENAYTAAFRQSGVLRAKKVEDLFDWGLAFSFQRGISGPRIAIVTNAGGPGIIATDAVESSSLKMAYLSRYSVESLRKVLPPAANIYNPIDVLGDASAERYEVALRVGLADPNVDGVIVILTPQTSTEAMPTSEVIARLAADTDKPVLACFIGGKGIAGGFRYLMTHGVPAYPFPERAVAAMDALHRQHVRVGAEVGEVPRFDVDKAKVEALFSKVRARGQLELGELEAREVAIAYGFRMPKSRLAGQPEEAVMMAREIGMPVVLKIASPDILHKSDVGGVRVGLETESQVDDAYLAMVQRVRRRMPNAEIRGVLVQKMVRGGKEVILGMVRDPQFGPLLMFGLGGIYVEALRDVAFRIAPITVTDATGMLGEIRARALLHGARGEPPVDLETIKEGLLRISQLVMDFPEIMELDVNPLLVFERGRGAIAIDARLTLAPQNE